MGISHPLLLLIAIAILAGSTGAIATDTLQGSGPHLNPFVEDSTLSPGETLVYHLENDGNESFWNSPYVGPFIIEQENGTQVQGCHLSWPADLQLVELLPPGERFTFHWNQTYGICDDDSGLNSTLVPPGVYTISYAGIAGSDVTFTIMDTDEGTNETENTDQESSEGSSQTLNWAIATLAMLGSIVIATVMLRSQRRY